ncbi:hypothetical protein [Nonomuraea dietziae]|uniref:right-handed parallel beta-helix repeat-containing protein n=1 Tax=Nonomuraea dietziae TaxID=65515 RepID=UPI0031D8909F
MRIRQRLALVGALVALSGGLAAPAYAAPARTFFVDCQASDGGSGRSASAPLNSLAAVNAIELRAKDKVRFRAGTVCAGRLEPIGSGSAEHPITFTSYGEGPKPIIQGDGGEWAVHLVDNSHLTIEKLHITNPAPATAKRTGIQYNSTTREPKAGLVLRDLEISDVAGWGNKTGANSAWFAYSAGISIQALPEGKVGYLDGITITGNYIHDTGGGGIKISRKGTDYHKNVYIARNTIREVGGDGHRRPCLGQTADRAQPVRRGRRGQVPLRRRQLRRHVADQLGRPRLPVQRGHQAAADDLRLHRVGLRRRHQGHLRLPVQLLPRQRGRLLPGLPELHRVPEPQGDRHPALQHRPGRLPYRGQRGGRQHQPAVDPQQHLLLLLAEGGLGGADRQVHDRQQHHLRALGHPAAGRGHHLRLQPLLRRRERAPASDAKAITADPGLAAPGTPPRATATSRATSCWLARPPSAQAPWWRAWASATTSATRSRAPSRAAPTTGPPCRRSSTTRSRRPTTTSASVPTSTPTPAASRPRDAATPARGWRRPAWCRAGR